MADVLLRSWLDSCPCFVWCVLSETGVPLPRARFPNLHLFGYKHKPVRPQEQLQKQLGLDLIGVWWTFNLIKENFCRYFTPNENQRLTLFIINFWKDPRLIIKIGEFFFGQHISSNHLRNEQKQLIKHLFIFYKCFFYLLRSIADQLTD